MGLQSLDDVLQEQVKDLLSAEKQLVAALPKVADAASSKELKKAISEHLEQTRGHVQRLEQVTGMLGMRSSFSWTSKFVSSVAATKPSSARCARMTGTEIPKDCLPISAR